MQRDSDNLNRRDVTPIEKQRPIFSVYPETVDSVLFWFKKFDV